MVRKKILWADDEIDMLRSHILFLQEKGYDVTPVFSGLDAVELIECETFDIVFIDENMPGISGLETLDRLKKIKPNVPVIMITKSEDEGIMTNAIGKKITDYLIKPVNPNQILLVLKKNLHHEDIVTEAVVNEYRNDFSQISEDISKASSFADWYAIYKTLTYWEVTLSNSNNPLLDSLLVQKQEANKMFAKCVCLNYEHWIQGRNEPPTLSHQLFSKEIFPLLEQDESILFLLIDNFRYDQWLAVKDLFSPLFNIQEDYHCSILPTATLYARNAIFAGLTPLQIQKQYPEYWLDESDEGSKNNNEPLLLSEQIKQQCKTEIRFSYHKLLSSADGEHLLNNLSELKNKPLNVIVANFVDMLSHARTDSKMIRELASDETAYRSLTYSWFKHSTTFELIKRLTNQNPKLKIVLTSDHGTIRVKKPLKIKGDKDLNSNLRYKVGKNIEYDRKKVYDVLKPENVGLPSPNISTRYIFACENNFFAYSNQYQHYVSYYADTFQHGGISMEEMIVPLITISSK